jgi:transcriptional regulator with XRE-family HTH domain
MSSIRTVIKKRVYQYQHSSDFKDIGSFIKKTRRKLQLTQDEVAKGICSISYLSKIENNQIIPTDNYVNEIMQRLDVDSELYHQSKRDKAYLDDMIETYFYQDEAHMHQLYKEIEHIKHDKIINLCKLAYYVQFNDQNTSSFVMMLEHLIGNMSNLELLFYIYLSIIYYVKMNLYKTALELYLMSQSIVIENEMVYALLYEISYYIKSRLLLTTCASEDYKKAAFLLQSTNAHKRVLALNLEKIKGLIRENPKRANQVLNQIHRGTKLQANPDQYHILKADIMMKLNKHERVMLHLKKIDDTSPYYMRKMVMMVQIAKYNNDYEMIQTIKTELKGYHPTQEEMHDKIMYHYLISYEEDKKDYLRDIAIPFSIKTEQFVHLDYYIHEIMDICIDTSRYKEATQYYKKYQKELSKIEKIL